MSTQQFHILSFEGPDPYARAGGIATRITGLTHALAEAGLEPHLWFVGDPDLPGNEQRGALTLHRWCQWLSRYHPGGVYDGEDAKRQDYAQSLPARLLNDYLLPQIARRERVVVLAEEWHTVDAVLHLDCLLRQAGVRDQVQILWNANNTFGFERIPFGRLQQAATIVTVSRYMKHRMWAFGVDPIVIPNGLGPESYLAPDGDAVNELRNRFKNRVVLAKVARWDPDKRWLLAVDIAAKLKYRGLRPLLIARGGVEAHEAEVLGRARALGLRVVERHSNEGGPRGLLAALSAADEADMVVLRSHLDPAARAVLLRGADAVLANSGHEPFGLVGLETMAVAGLACTGASGEDYAVDGENALVLSRNDPDEFAALYARLRQSPALDSAIRDSGSRTAASYAWSRVVDRTLLPRLGAR
jgi:glycosyltransferase involved in cell wall biosynthesis